MAQLRSPNFDARLPRERLVLLSVRRMSVWSKTHLSRKKTKKSLQSSARVRVPSVLLFSPRLSSRLRPRLGALSLKCLIFGEQTRQQRLFSPNDNFCRCLPFRRLSGSHRSQLLSYLVAARSQRRSLSLLGTALRVCGGTAPCVRVNPQARVQPIAFSHH